VSARATPGQVFFAKTRRQVVRPKNAIYGVVMEEAKCCCSALIIAASAALLLPFAFTSDESWSHRRLRRLRRDKSGRSSRDYTS
jgi:hypothetical protein